MKLNKAIKFILTACFGLGLSACGNTNGQNSWNLTKEDLSEVLELTLTPSLVDNQKQYVAAHYEPFLKGELTENDLIFFNAHDAYADLENEDYNGDILDLNLIKEYKVDYTSVSTDSDFTQFKVVAPKSTNNKVGVIINKSKTINNNYVIATIDNAVTGKTPTAEEQFERDYGHSSPAKFSPIVTGIIGGVSSIIGGIISEPLGTGLIACGIGQLINVILGNSLTFNEPGIRDVLKKLYVIDERLQLLDAKMTQNFDDIKTQQKVTQSYINQAILLEYENTINEFETTYMGGVRKYLNSFEVKCLNRFKELAQGPLQIKIPYYYNDDNILSYRPFVETSDNPSDNVVTIDIASFPKTIAKLPSTKNIFNSLVLPEFQADIYDATSSITLPDQMTREILSDFAIMRLAEEFIKFYFEGHASEAIEFTSSITEFCNRFNGVAATPILTTYLNRLQYMFNFGSEIRDPYNTILCNLRMFLRNVVSIATQASVWAESSYDSLETAFTSAENAFVLAGNTVDEIPDNYSFILQRKVKASLFSSYTDSYFTTKGNFPTHYNKFRLFRYSGTNIQNKTEVEYNDYDAVKADDHYSLSLRMSNLKKYGYVAGDTTYKQYLINQGILDADVDKLITNGIEAKVIKNNANQIATTMDHRNVRDDERVNCFFTDVGRGDMSYFKVTGWYFYKSQHGSEYWHATCWDTSIVDINTGKCESTTKQIIGLEGCYDEGHKYWRIDERYRFNGLPSDYFFLAMVYEN